MMYPIRKGFSCKLVRSVALLLVIILPGIGFAQVPLTNVAPTVTIDFSNTTPSTVGSNPQSAFSGAGFSPNPTQAGRLNSNAWSIVGQEPTDLNYGGTQTGNDYSLGATAIAVAQGGIYAFTGAPASAANPMFMIQQSGGSFVPDGSVTLRFVNNGTTPISAMQVKYKVYVRNDQGRSSSVNMEWSNDGVNFTPFGGAASYTTPATSVVGPVFLGSDVNVNISGFGVAVTQFGYIRWTISDVAGTGNRDEIMLDDIELTASYAAPCTPPSTQASGTASGVMPGQMNINYTRGNGNGGLLVVAVPTAVLSAQPLNSIVYTANPNYGAGSPIGNGFVVHNSNAASGSFTVFNLSASTLYRFYFFEYNVISNPCYLSPSFVLTQSTPSPVTNPSGFFRTRATGNWNDVASWESGPSSGGPWVNADLTPTSAAGGIEIRASHTITLTGNESARLLNINAGGVLTSNNQSTGGWPLNLVNDGTAAYDLIVGGRIELFGNSPINGSVNTATTANILTGGVVMVLANYPPSQADDFAYLGSTGANRAVFETDAVYDWNTNTFTFESTNRTYLSSVNTLLKSPIFRLSQTTNFTIGSASQTSIFGHLEVNADNVFANAGLKTFRDGISGTAKLTQAVGCGTFRINGASFARLGGTGVLELNSTGLEIASSSPNGVMLISNKTINNGATNVILNGRLNCGVFNLNGTTAFTLLSGGYLGMGSPQGITTGAAGNIQTATRTFNAGGRYHYMGLVAQQTGNALPSSIAYLTLEPANGTTITLTSDLAVTTEFRSEFEANFDISNRILQLSGSLSFVNPAPDNANNFGFIGNENTTLISTGNLSQHVTFNSTGSKLGILRMNRTSASLFINNRNLVPLEIFGGIEFTPSNGGTLNFQHKEVVLKSTISHTAYLGRIYGSATNMSNVTVERYIPTGVNHGKSWQFISMPLHSSSTQTIHESWQEGAAAPNADPNPGFGTMVTGVVPNATDLAVGFDAYTPNGSTVKKFNPTTGGYDNITNTKSTPVVTNNGYMVLVRGDRSVVTHNGAANPTVLRAKGILTDNFINTPAPISVPAGTFASIGNPYACKVDFTTIFRIGGMDNVFYVWDPTLAGVYGLGGFQTLSNSNGFMPVPGGTTNFPSGVPVTTIESGQAFMVHATGSTGNMMFEEQNKISGSNMVFRNTTPIARPAIMLNLKTSTGILGDGNKVVFGSEFSNDYNGLDAVKFINTGENIFTILRDKRIAVESRKHPVVGDTIQYGFSNIVNGNYKLEFDIANFASRGNIKAILKDRFTGLEHDLSLSGKTNVDVSFTNIPASKAVNRFFVVFISNRMNVKTHFAVDKQTNVWPNPLTGSVLNLELTDCKDGTYEVLFNNVSGVVFTRKTIQVVNGRYSGYIQVPFNLPRGVYKLEILGREDQFSVQVVK